MCPEEHSGGGDNFTLQMAAVGSSATFTTRYKTAPRHTSETAGFLLYLWPKHVAEFMCIDNVWFYKNRRFFVACG